MIPYSRQKIEADDIAAVVRVLRSDWLTQGPNISAFEQALAKYCGQSFAVAVPNGTAALHLAYLAAGIGKGDEIITSPNTFVATTNMAIVCGAKSVFCDIRLDTYNIDEGKIERLITEKTKALVPVDFAGHPCELAKILRIARKHKLLVIEDACHALGARYHGKKVGGLGSDMTIFSFHPVKPITTAEGGAILTNNKEFYDRMVRLRNHGIHRDKLGKNVMTELGFNYRITDLQAALGLSQLPKLERFIRRRRQVVAWYHQELGRCQGIVLPRQLAGSYSGWHLFIIRVVNPKHRDALSEYLKANGIGANFHYPAVYSHPYYRQHGFGKFSLPNEEVYHHTAVTIPCHQQLTRGQVRFISKTIKEFFAHAAA